MRIPEDIRAKAEAFMNLTEGGFPFDDNIFESQLNFMKSKDRCAFGLVMFAIMNGDTITELADAWRDLPARDTDGEFEEIQAVQWANDYGACCGLTAAGRRQEKIRMALIDRFPDIDREKLNETILIIEDEDSSDILD